MSQCYYQSSQIHIGSYYVALLGEIGGFAYDVVAAVKDFRYHTHLSGIGLCGYDTHSVAHGNGVGTAYSLQAEVALYLTLEKLAVVQTDNVPASCVLDDNALH
jgi:hypothetical protein